MRLNHFDLECLNMVVACCGGDIRHHLTNALQTYKDAKLYEISVRNVSNDKIRRNLEQTKLA